MRYIPVFLVVFLIQSLSHSVYSQMIDDDLECKTLAYFHDQKAFAESLSLDSITYENSSYRLILNRRGDSFLIRPFNRDRFKTFRLNLEVEQRKDEDDRALLEKCPNIELFDKIAYSIMRLGITQMPETIEGALYDMGSFHLKLVFGNRIVERGFSTGFASVPEYDLVASQIAAVAGLEDFWRPYLPESILKQAKLSSVAFIKPKGRVQDQRIHLVENLVAVGKPSVPWLIEQLDDDTPIKHYPMNYWGVIKTSDLALIVLSDLFQNKEGERTIPGFDWDRFLGRESQDITAKNLLYEYVKKHGRSHIKERWESIWNKNKDRIEWNWDCNCYELTDLESESSQ